MTLLFYNSLSKKKENFIPIEDSNVRLYTCGPTVYDVAHIGNFRTFIFEDLLKRFLMFKDYSVTHVMNITDVDDKTIRRSIKEGIALSELTQKYTKLFFKDLTWLKIIPADTYPKATDHVTEMIKMIQILFEKDFAYLTKDNSIFFNISKYPEYGKLINIQSDYLQSSERISEDEYSKLEFPNVHCPLSMPGFTNHTLTKDETPERTSHYSGFGRKKKLEDYCQTMGVSLVELSVPIPNDESGESQ